jgi:hypothetical protein
MRYRCTVGSADDGPPQNAEPGCPRGHRINAPIEALTRDKHPSTAAPATTAPAISRLGGRPRRAPVARSRQDTAATIELALPGPPHPGASQARWQAAGTWTGG